MGHSMCGFCNCEPCECEKPRKVQMSKANERQVGGDHYRKTDGWQHWDLVERFGMGYCEAVASKYVLRFRDKDGLKDLEKAKHYIAKLLELVEEGVRPPFAKGSPPIDQIAWLSNAHDLTPSADMAWMLLCTWHGTHQLKQASEAIDRVILGLKKEARHIDNSGQEHPFGFDYRDEEGR